mmetsp:Transcript_19363/g.45030  ORF Transcript_19363/g.45030 Transcript_19363/m.45030 type:complete len:350 (-) Transcript_19363:42-1091(-)
MDSAIKYVLKTYLEEYVLGLDNLDTSSLPVTLSNLTLKEAKIKEDMEQDSNSPLQFIDGTIGKVQFQPVSLFGRIRVVASDVVLNLNFNPIKAVQRAMRPPVDDELDEQNQVPMDIQEKLAGVQAPSAVQTALIPPKAAAQASAGRSSTVLFCEMHKRSEKRPKAAFRRAPCNSCGTVLDTNFAELTHCASCAEKKGRCMICGNASSSSSTAGAHRRSSSTPKSPQTKELEDFSLEDLLSEKLSKQPIASSNIRASSRSSGGLPGAAPVDQAPSRSLIHGSAVAAMASLLPGRAVDGINCGGGNAAEKQSLFGMFHGCGGVSSCSSTRQHDSRDYTHVEPPVLPKSMVA